LAQSITPLAGDFSRARIVAWPLVVEATLVAAVIGLLAPLYASLAAQDGGRDARFAAPVAVVRDLPGPVLPELCASIGALAEDLLRARLCEHAKAVAAAHVERMPASLARALERANAAFRAPVAEADARIEALRRQQREGSGDLLALDQAIDAAGAEVEPYVRRYALDPGGVQGPRALACAAEGAQDALASTAPRSGAARDMLRANVVLLLAAALDGHAATAALAASATLPHGLAASPRCSGVVLPDALAQAASVMADARSAPANVLKNEAMRDLLHTARWQWAGAAMLGLALLNLSRRRIAPLAGVGLALALWAIAAWAARVPWPLGGEHAFVLARPSSSLLTPPALFVVVMLGVAACLLLLSPWVGRRGIDFSSRPASMLGYPGLVLATGVGWLMLLDLSANGHYGNRYLALYHQGHLWLALMAFSVIVFVRQPLGRALAWGLSMIDGAAARLARAIGAPGSGALLLVLALLGTASLALALQNLRQLTSELGRLWLIVGAAWFFFLRGTPFTERLARSGSSLASLLRYVWPLAFVVIVLIGAMLVTRDMGPLLIAGYAAGAFVAASIAMWLHQRTGATRIAYALAAVLFAGWIALTTAALFRLGSIDDVTAARLENASAPLASANDHLALVTWFQRAAPASGFGPGAVPWCGYGAGRACAGVPAQIQSDYTFTALVGTFGWATAWALTLGCVLWLEALVRRHARATRGEPRLVRAGARLRSDEQGFVSWLAVTWVVLALCQLAVTVAGNLAVIPLTGVTFPFVSFGMTSLVANAAMLALAIDVVRRPDDA